MKRFLGLLLLAMLLPGAAPARVLAQGQTDRANVMFTAVDEGKRAVTTLRKEDIRVLEEGVPQEITAFRLQMDRPLSLAILIDVSVSQEHTLPVQTATAKAFTTSLLRPGKDRAAIITFRGETTLEQEMTGDIGRVQEAIARIKFEPPPAYAGGGILATDPSIIGRSKNDLKVIGSTAIWDAIWVTSDEVFEKTMTQTRRAIILLTDGQDTSSRKKLSAAVDQAIRSDVVIYTIGIGEEIYGGVNKEALHKISERTGGHAFFPKNVADLSAAFAEIEQELRAQYLVSYQPANSKVNNPFRKVRIEIINPELRARSLHLAFPQGYFTK